jgi:hypothetical protein
VYKTDLKTAHEAGRSYAKDKGYTRIDVDVLDKEKSKLHVLKQAAPEHVHPESLIIQARFVEPNLTSVEMKVGPNYSQTETCQMMDEYQKLLPESAQPQ